MTDDPHLQRLLDRAHARIDHNDILGAFDILHEVLTLDPDVVEAHALLALCLIDLHSLGSARAEAETALDLDSESAFAHQAMGNVSLVEGKLEAAEAHYEQARALEPDNATHYESMANLDAHRDRPYRHWLDQAIALAPEDPSILAAISHERFLNGDLAEARRHADHALASDPEHGDALLAKARVLLHAGEVDDARVHVIAALQADATDADALRLLVAVRARHNPVLGAWMRWSLWTETMSPGKRVAWLVGMLVGCRLLAQVFSDLGLPRLSGFVQTAWLAFVAYSWVGPEVFRRLLRRELADVQLDDTY